MAYGMTIQSKLNPVLKLPLPPIHPAVWEGAENRKSNMRWQAQETKEFTLEIEIEYGKQADGLADIL